MSSLHPSTGLHSRHLGENPTVLTIRRVEAADTNGSRSIFGEHAGRVGIRSAHTEKSNFGKVNTETVGFATSDSGGNAEKPGFLKAEISTSRASTEKLRVGEVDNSELRSSGVKSGLHRVDDLGFEVNREESKPEFEAGGYGAGSGVGGKLRSLRRVNKRSPYDRPVTGRHATAGGSAASLPSSKLTVASRLRDSASKFIYSSASYVFSALFKRAPPFIKANGESKHTGVSIVVEEERCKERLETPSMQIDLSPGPASQVPASVDAGLKSTEAEGMVLDIIQVEEILKQKTWSREQVNHLTQILQTRVSENDACSPLTEKVEKIKEQPKSEAKGSSPVQVARAYMGEQATRPAGIAATVHKSAFISTEVKSSPVCTLEDRYLSSPFSRNWARSSAAVRMPKRSLAREDDLASVGPTRRVRQKTSMLTNSSPHSWRMTGVSRSLETRISSPPSQSSQTALKILETLEKLSPSPQGKFLEVSPDKSVSGLGVLRTFSPTIQEKFSNEIVGLAGTSSSEQTPESSKLREKVFAQTLGSVPSPKVTELKPIDKITSGGMNFNNSEPVKKSSIEAPSSSLESHHVKPVVGKGFRMNAVFEESNYDQEAKVQANLHASTQVRDRVSPNNLKEEATATPNSDVCSTRADLSMSFLPEPKQALASSVVLLESCSLPLTPPLPDKPAPSVTTISQADPATFPSFSFPTVTMETRLMSPGELASSSVATEVKLLVEKVSRAPNLAGAKLAFPSLFARQTEASEMAAASTTTMASLSTSCEIANTSVSLPAFVATTAPDSLGDASTDAVNIFSSPVSITSRGAMSGMDVPEIGNAVIMATESPVSDKLAEVETMASDSMAEEADMSTAAPPASFMPIFLPSAHLQPSTASIFSFAAGVSSTSSSVATLPFGGGLDTGSIGAPASSTSTPSFLFGGQSSTVSAGRAPNSLTAVSASFPSAAAVTFGGQPNNVSAGQVPTFPMGISPSSAASFAFGCQSDIIPVGQAPSLVAKPSVVFDQSSAGSTGQAPSFGTLLSSSANPFSSIAGNLSSPFTFGSSTAAVFGSPAVSSTSSMFISSSSGVPSFGGSSTFQFGSPAESSSSMSTPSMSSITTNSFMASPFSSTPAPTLSAAPTFSFGSSTASTSYSSSAPAGQLYTFNVAHSNPFASNPFSSSGIQNPAHTFGFGASAMAATSSPFSSSGSSTSIFASNSSPNASSVFAFGSNSTPNTSSPFTFGSGQLAPAQAPTPSPSAFGGQSAAVPPASGQLFAFGGAQTAEPAPNRFSAAGTPQAGPEFTGGFTLGPTSGDKSGRKFIKAKRIGGTKRGK